MKIGDCPWLIEKPSSPSIWDDEFEGDELDLAKWTRTYGPGGVTSTALLDRLDTTFLGPNTHHYESFNRHRPSWLMAQPAVQAAGGNTANGYLQTLTGLPTDCWFQIRAGVGHRRTAISETDGEVLVRLYNAGVGTSTYVLVGIDTNANIIEGFMGRNNASVFTVMGLARNYFGEGFPIEYIGIQKRNNTYDGWVASSSGVWVWLGQTTFVTAAFDTAQIAFDNVLSKQPGRMMTGMDYFRVYPNFRGPP